MRITMRIVIRMNLVTKIARTAAQGHHLGTSRDVKIAPLGTSAYYFGAILVPGVMRITMRKVIRMSLVTKIARTAAQKHHLGTSRDVIKIAPLGTSACNFGAQGHHFATPLPPPPPPQRAPRGVVLFIPPPPE